MIAMLHKDQLAHYASGSIRIGKALSWASITQKYLDLYEEILH